MSTTLRRHELFIGGEWTPGAGGGAQEIVNPATGKVIAHVPKGTEDDVNRAVAAARKAFDEGWADTTPRERSERMLKLAGAIEANGDELARIESENVGKPLAATRSEEIPPIVDCIRFFAGAARILEGKAAGEYMQGFTSMVRREPLGVVGSIAPTTPSGSRRTMLVNPCMYSPAALPSRMRAAPAKKRMQSTIGGISSDLVAARGLPTFSD